MTAKREPSHHVFTYGSLMFPDVFLGVTGQLAQAAPAIAIGWRRYGLKGKTYPGAIPTGFEHDQIHGVIWQGLSEQMVRALDAFEDKQYERVTTTVLTQDNQRQSVQIYQWLEHDALDGSWDPTTFDKLYRSGFVQAHGIKQG
jgi:gamma-glutamylcyclotransferase (GGCT)/AIG2-like uncharacterized protein YtfP